MKTCVIFCAGGFSALAEPVTGSYVIAADGGYDALLKMGLTPDVLVGDFDSVKAVPEGIECVRHPTEKDETDTYLAYRIGVERGFFTFRVFGGVGGRADHTFANYALLLGAKNEGKNITLVDKNAEITVIKNEKVLLFGDAGKTVSVFAIGGDAKGVTLRGLKYEAEGINLSCAFPLGVSNSFINQGISEISVEDGALLIYREI